MRKQQYVATDTGSASTLLVSKKLINLLKSVWSRWRLKVWTVPHFTRRSVREFHMLILRGTKEYRRALIRQWDLTIWRGWPRLRTRYNSISEIRTNVAYSYRVSAGGHFTQSQWQTCHRHPWLHV